MAELHGRRLALDEGSRPRTDEGGRLVYVDAETGAATEDSTDALADGQGIHTEEDIPPEDLDPENGQPIPTPPLEG